MTPFRKCAQNFTRDQFSWSAKISKTSNLFNQRNTKISGNFNMKLSCLRSVLTLVKVKCTESYHNVYLFIFKSRFPKLLMMYIYTNSINETLKFPVTIYHEMKFSQISNSSGQIYTESYQNLVFSQRFPINFKRCGLIKRNT